MAEGNGVSLKEYILSELRAVRDSHKQDVDALKASITSRDTALELQANADKKHFADLNHEAARLQAAVAANVSRDSWDAFTKTDKEWKDKVDRLLQDALPRAEFQTFKESTGQAGAVRSGVATGIGASANTIYFLIIALTAVGVLVVSVLNYLKH